MKTSGSAVGLAVLGIAGVQVEDRRAGLGGGDRLLRRSGRA